MHYSLGYLREWTLKPPWPLHIKVELRKLRKNFKKEERERERPRKRLRDRASKR